jgi:integrase/recombinase XerD
MNHHGPHCPIVIGLPCQREIACLIEDGWDAKFVQDQAGHEHASTTSLYTGVSSDFRTRTLRRVLDRTIKDALSFGEETS